VKFVKLVQLVGFNIKKFVTMHGYINVKKCIWYITVEVLNMKPITLPYYVLYPGNLKQV